MLLVNLINDMQGKRGVFFSADGHIGSGPITMADGDEILILKGVAVPMIARRRENSGSCVFTLLGPAFMCGYMGLLQFEPGTVGKDGEEHRFH